MASSPQMIPYVSMPLAHMLLGLGIGNAWVALRMQTCAKIEPKVPSRQSNRDVWLRHASVRSNEALCSLASILAPAIDLFPALYVADASVFVRCFLATALAAKTQPSQVQARTDHFKPGRGPGTS